MAQPLPPIRFAASWLQVQSSDPNARRPTFFLLLFAATFWLPCWLVVATAQQPVVVPRRQIEPPGPPLSPKEAIAKMRVPPGFHVELVAAEPDIQNPVAMAFDDRGRIYVTESFEYPRKEAGPGRDRIKLLEDTDGDGQVDSVKIFADGLNIPSGIAVGHGGVWVANAPDLLFLQDTNGDDRADQQTVIMTGFGRDDTHELPNALTWGPDGWLYGLNGVFNPSHIQHQGQRWDFTCAMFRIHPESKRFELFSEGTSNPWGIAFDREGSAFISACVIDHLWHLTETGYYHRQGGPYPTHTWKLESIVNYTHQMAAYCGIEYFDSTAYPTEYRGKLYMGNIHGGCINVDSISRVGATYRGTKEPDFLSANDVWFMPVAQKVGPDGCLYVLDWYDRYHCYQDASADPQGVDRGHGRLYRIVHNQRPKPSYRELKQADWLTALHDPNIFWRQRALVNLASTRDPHLRLSLSQQSLDRKQNTDYRLRAMWGLIGASQVTPQLLNDWLEDPEPLIQAWAIRAAAHQPEVARSQLSKLESLARSPDARVRVEVAIAARKLMPETPSQWLLKVAEHDSEDPLISKIVWRNLMDHSFRADNGLAISIAIQDNPIAPNSCLAELLPRLAARVLAEINPQNPADSDAQFLEAVYGLCRHASSTAPATTQSIRRDILSRLQQGQLPRQAYRDWWMKFANIPLQFDEDWVGLQLLAMTDDETLSQKMQMGILNPKYPEAERLSMAKSLLVTRPDRLEWLFDQVLASQGTDRELPSSLQDYLLSAVASQAQSSWAQRQNQLLMNLARFPTGVQAMVASRMCQRDESSLLLLQSMLDGHVPKDLVGPNQVQQLAKRTPAIKNLVANLWGEVRSDTPSDRQKVVSRQTDYLLWDATGDPKRGWVIYDRVCGQCHQLEGRGHEVGPDITRNGRGSFEQLISSVFDPSLVIGEAYRSVIVATDDGRVLQGIVLQRTDDQLVLRVQGGKTESLATSEIAEIKENTKSLMPEGLETQLNQQEIADLFALLALEEPSKSGESKRIRGTPAQLVPSK